MLAILLAFMRVYGLVFALGAGLATRVFRLHALLFWRSCED